MARGEYFFLHFPPSVIILPIAQGYTEITGKRVVENARQTLQFYSGICGAHIYQITPVLPCGLCSSYRVKYDEMKTNVT